MRKATPLKLARIAMGMSQADLAQRINRHQTLISHFETARILVSARDKKAISKVLKTSEDVLFR